jgi:hypothetical protein
MPNNFCGTPKCFWGAKTKIRVVKKINPGGGVENVSKHRIYFRGQIKKIPHTKKKSVHKKCFHAKRYFYGQISKILEYFPTWPSIVSRRQTAIYVIRPTDHDRAVVQY